MHQVFYADVDEEITSLTDKLRKSSLKENVFVIPKGALIFQSILSLKLFKKEAEDAKKQIMIVTQDKLGRMMAEKGGILVQASMDGLDDQEIVGEEMQTHIEEMDERVVSGNEETRERLDGLGADSFFNKIEPKRRGRPRKNSTKKAIDTKKDKRKKSSISIPVAVQGEVKSNKRGVRKNTRVDTKMDSHKEKEFEKLFGFNNRMNQATSRSSSENEKVESRKLINFFWILGGVCLLVALGVGVYLFLPKAEVKVSLQSEIEKVDLEIRGSVNSEIQEENLIPVKMTEEEDEITLSYSATGESFISDQKAQGTVVIYNEYSTSPQPLVATTRLLTSDGRLFRIIEGVVVPGTTKIGDETKPGVVEVGVVADESGEKYNIDPSKFTIPGFKGGPKHDKFYAESKSKMLGGGASEDKIAVVSQGDIDLAKVKTEETLKNKLLEKIKNQTEGEVVLDDAIKIEIVNGTSFPGIDMVAENFDYTVRMKIEIITFSQDALEEIIKGSFNGEIDYEKMELIDSVTEYGHVDANFEDKSLTFKIHTEALFQNKINQGNLKNDLLGKNEVEIRDVLNKYESIKAIEIDFWPQFLPSQIPKYEKKVNIYFEEPAFK